MSGYSAGMIEANYTYWAAFNDGTLDPATFGASLVRFVLAGEYGTLYHDFRPGQAPCIYLANDPGAKPGEVLDIGEPVQSVVVVTAGEATS